MRPVWVFGLYPFFPPPAWFLPFATEVDFQWQLETELLFGLNLQTQIRCLLEALVAKSWHLRASHSRTIVSLYCASQLLSRGGRQSPTTLLLPAVNSRPRIFANPVILSFGSPISRVFGDNLQRPYCEQRSILGPVSCPFHLISHLAWHSVFI